MDYNNILNKNALKIIESLRKNRLYLNQIYEETKIKSKNNLLKNLDIMRKLNIVKMEKNKGNTFYSINYENNIAITFLQVIDMIKLQNLPFERRKAILEVAEKAKPTLAILFGSTAKNNFKEKSDIDLLLVDKNALNQNDKIINEIGKRYGIKIGSIAIKFENFDIRDSTINHIIKTGYPITGGIYFYNEYKKI